MRRGVILVGRLGVAIVNIDEVPIWANDVQLMVTGHIACLLGSVRLGMGRMAILVKEKDRKALIIVSLHPITCLFISTLFFYRYITDRTKAGIVAQTFYNMCISIIKLSILALYSRIFSRASALFSSTVWGTAVFVFLVMIPQCLTYILKCVPVHAQWDLKPGDKVTCIDFYRGMSQVAETYSSFNPWIFASDVTSSNHCVRHTQYSDGLVHPRPSPPAGP